MSRHRFVRNLGADDLYEDELGYDDAFDYDEEYFDYVPQSAHSLAPPHIRQVSSQRKGRTKQNHPAKLKSDMNITSSGVSSSLNSPSMTLPCPKSVEFASLDSSSHVNTNNVEDHNIGVSVSLNSPDITNSVEAHGVDNLSTSSGPSFDSRSESKGHDSRRIRKPLELAMCGQVVVVVEEEEEEEEEEDVGKPKLGLAVCGHVDAGKSTLMGHFLYLIGCVPQRLMRKYEQQSKSYGKESFAFAWVLDEQQEERTRGITMDVATTYFETSSLSVTLLDTPGHKDFVSSMITGVSQADAAILVVSAAAGEFEAGFDRLGQTREHAQLIRSFGIVQLVVVVSQMDRVDWKQDRFKEVCSLLGPFLKRVGFPVKSLSFVPCSGITGENLIQSQEKLHWYSGSSLVECIDRLVPAQPLYDAPLRICVADVYHSRHLGLWVAGRVESGSFCVGAQLVLLPENSLCKVKGIRKQDDSLSSAVAGDNIDLSLSGLDQNMVRIGSVLCGVHHPVPVARCFLASVVVFEADLPVLQGQNVLFHHQHSVVPACIVRIISAQVPGKKEKISHPRMLTSKNVAKVEILLDYPICLETFATVKTLSRFALRSGGRTIATGIIKDLLTGPKEAVSGTVGE